MTPGDLQHRGHGEQAQRAALRRHRQPGVGEEAGNAPGRLKAGVVEGRGVLYGPPYRTAQSPVQV